MLFVSNQPVKVQVTDQKKIVILTKTKIMFTTFDYIDEFLSMPLVGSEPKTFHYAPETL